MLEDIRQVDERQLGSIECYVGSPVVGKKASFRKW